MGRALDWWEQKQNKGEIVGGKRIGRENEKKQQRVEGRKVAAENERQRKKLEMQ